MAALGPHRDRSGQPETIAGCRNRVWQLPLLNHPAPALPRMGEPATSRNQRAFRSVERALHRPGLPEPAPANTSIAELIDRIEGAMATFRAARE